MIKAPSHANPCPLAQPAIGNFWRVLRAPSSPQILAAQADGSDDDKWPQELYNAPFHMRSTDWENSSPSYIRYPVGCTSGVLSEFQTFCQCFAEETVQWLQGNTNDSTHNFHKCDESTTKMRIAAHRLRTLQQVKSGDGASDTRMRVIGRSNNKPTHATHVQSAILFSSARQTMRLAYLHWQDCLEYGVSKEVGSGRERRYGFGLEDFLFFEQDTKAFQKSTLGEFTRAVILSAYICLTGERGRER